MVGEEIVVLPVWAVLTSQSIRPVEDHAGFPRVYQGLVEHESDGVWNRVGAQGLGPMVLGPDVDPIPAPTSW